MCRFKSGAGADWGVRESRTAAIELTAGLCCAIGGFPSMCLLWACARLEQSVRWPASRGFCVAQAPEEMAVCKGVCALSEAAPHVPLWLANQLPAPRRLPPAAVPAAGVWRPAAGLRRPAAPGATCAAAHVTDLLQHFLPVDLWVVGGALARAEGPTVCASAAAGVRPAAPAGAAEAEPGLPGGLVRPAPVGTWLAFGFQLPAGCKD